MATGDQIYNDYNTLKTDLSSNYISTNLSSKPSIINAINENLAELTLIQNQLNTNNNINQEILVKKDQLLRMKNDDLMKQLQDLERIESNISNKNRILEQTNYNIQQQNTNITNLIISIILAVIICLVVYLYGIDRISQPFFILVLIIIGLIYLFLFLYTYNIFYVRDAILYLFNARSLQSLENRLTTWSNAIANDINTEIKNKEQEWIDSHCSCPVREDVVEEQVYSYDTNQGVNEQGGYFYYDGTAPAQLLVNTPDPKQITINNKIDWVDYSSNGNMSYNSRTKVTSYDNTHYYNYKNTTDPNMALEKKLNDPASYNLLVDSETYTVNL
jgi:F0F1-type ATP synthase assembly protein I